MRFFLLLLTLCFYLPADDTVILNRLKQSIIKHYNEIHAKQTTRPMGIWYSNTLATLLNQRYKDLFSEDWTGYCDEELFRKIGNGMFQLRPGRSATDALYKVINGVSIMDCGNVSQLVYYLAISDLVGKQTFDNYVAKSSKPLFIATYTTDAPKDSVLFDFLTEVQIPSPSSENKRPLTIGQLCYFRNYLNYLIRHPTGNAQGYNAIYLGYNNKGEQEYISFWDSGPKTENEVIALLKERYFTPQDEWDILYFTKHPGERQETTIDPNYEFFDAKNIYSYVFNLETLKQLLKEPYIHVP